MKFDTLFTVIQVDVLLNEDVLIGQDIFADKKVRGVIENGQFKFEKVNIGNAVQGEISLECGDVDDSTKSVLITLVTSFGDVFANDLSQIGKTDVVELEIELDTDKPITQAPYRMPEPKKSL